MATRKAKPGTKTRPTCGKWMVKNGDHARVCKTSSKVMTCVVGTMPAYDGSTLWSGMCLMKNKSSSGGNKIVYNSMVLEPTAAKAKAALDKKVINPMKQGTKKFVVR